MSASIITIGTEILIGQIVDTNSAFIGQKLTEIGINVQSIQSIPDDKQTILNTLQFCNADIIIITGGLGPTQDDITKKTLAEFFNTELVLNNNVLQHITHLFEKILGRKMNEKNVQQAYVPSNAKILHNKAGTAPGMWFEENNKIYISLPGVPFEMKNLMNDFVLPKLQEQFSLPFIIQKHLLLVNIPESELAILLEDWENNLPENISVAYLPKAARIRMRLTIEGNDKPKIEEELQTQINKLKLIIAPYLQSEKGEILEELLQQKFIAKSITLSTAESCTGGNIAHQITKISGSSAYYIGGLITYATRIKEQFLHISHELIENETVVSEAVAKAMAEGIRKQFSTDYGLAITGVAGPNLGEDKNEIGTAYIAVANKDNTWIKKIFYPNLQRQDFIEIATLKALDFLYECV